MYRRWLCCARNVLILPLLLVAVSAMAAPAAPTLFRITSAKPELLLQGAQKSWPIKFDENAAMDAVFQGGMWLPNPEGGRIYAKYQRHILHANGIWTWIGTVSTVHGAQSVMLTFGKHAMFGYIPQASGWPLEISSAHGQTRIMATSAKALARSTAWLRLHSKPDAVIPPLSKRMKAAATGRQALAAASESSPATIDVMVAYTPGFVTVYGSQNAAMTRIQFLVDWTNQAYVNSQVYQQIRLVHTVEVDYPDNNTDTDALYDLTGSNDSGPVPIPPSLQGIAPLRAQYGADLVAMIRPFDAAAEAANECGVGWLDGTGETVPIAKFGYSVVSDKADSTVTDDHYCDTNTFAHELGHNMGDAHDRANATSVGAYRYSYGYLGNGTYGFSTIMAYETATATPLQVFSNPNISTCQNTPCGVPDDASDSADNAHSMNNTAPVIAAFEPTKVGNPTAGYVHNDVNGDGISDIVEYNASPSRLGWWLMNGTSVISYSSQFVSPTYRVVATGDFNGDGKTDMIWQDMSNNVYIWLSNGGSFTSQFVAKDEPGWGVVGAGDVNGDGYSDLLVYNPSPARLGWWIMDGAKVLSYHSQLVNSTWRFATTGDFVGDGEMDVVWVDPLNNVYLWTSTGGGFTSSFVARNAPGWSIVGAGDVNGDGEADLLVYNPSPARLGWWLMNGYNVLSYHSQATGGSAWQFTTTGDFNGDGKTDVAWLVGGNALYFWTSKGGGFTQAGPVGRYTPGWLIIP